MKCESVEWPPALLENGIGMRTDFNDERFVKRFNRAKRTLIRLASKDEDWKIPMLPHHLGWGNYEYRISGEARCGWKKSFVPFYGHAAITDEGICVVKCKVTCKHNKNLYDGKILCGNGVFVFLVKTPYGKYEPVGSGQSEARIAAKEDAHRMLITTQDVMCVLAWQEYKEYVSSYHKLVFKKDILRWQKNQIAKTLHGTNYCHSKKFIDMVENGDFKRAKNAVSAISKFSFARSAAPGRTASDSMRQLRALGFVA